MKIKQLLLKFFLILIFFILCSSCISYASEDIPIEGDADQMLPTLGEGYRPTVTSATKAKDIISKILGFMRVLGIVVMVVAVAAIGFCTIMGSANDKAVSQEKFVGIFIASLMLIGGSSLAIMIMSAAEKLG